MKPNLLFALSLIIFPVFLSAQPCVTKLSAGAHAYASTVHDNREAGHVTDGDPNSRWESHYSDPQWIVIDLGVVQTICSVVLRWENAAARDFEVQVSGNASSWTTVATVTNNATLNNTIGFSAQARYVRIYGTVRTTSYGYSLYEAEVFGTPAASSSGTNLAVGRPAVASSATSPTNSAAHAFDNDPGTRWESNFTDNEFIYVDLGSQHSIEKVVLRWEAAYGRNFQIQFSNDASTWSTAYNFTGNYSLINHIYVSGNARYVRMNGINRATGYGYSLLEFGVFGSNTVLPVSLTQFTLKKALPQPELEWKTSAEPNFASFEIERRSGSASSFLRIGTIKARGTDNSGNNYSWTDLSPITTTTYYRLKLLDTDGRFRYSEIVAVRPSPGGNEMQWHYNSASKLISIQTEGDEIIRNVMVLNSAGLPVVTAHCNENVKQLSLAEKPSGVYFIHIQTTKRKVVERVVR